MSHQPTVADPDPDVDYSDSEFEESFSYGASKEEEEEGQHDFAPSAYQSRASTAAGAQGPSAFQVPPSYFQRPYNAASPVLSQAMATVVDMCRRCSLPEVVSRYPSVIHNTV